jgi:hypothetical protein
VTHASHNHKGLSVDCEISIKYVLTGQKSGTSRSSKSRRSRPSASRAKKDTGPAVCIEPAGPAGTAGSAEKGEPVAAASASVSVGAVSVSGVRVVEEAEAMEPAAKRARFEPALPAALEISIDAENDIDDAEEDGLLMDLGL